MFQDWANKTRESKLSKNDFSSADVKSNSTSILDEKCSTNRCPNIPFDPIISILFLSIFLFHLSGTFKVLDKLLFIRKFCKTLICHIVRSKISRFWVTLRFFTSFRMTICQLFKDFFYYSIKIFTILVLLHLADSNQQ